MTNYTPNYSFPLIEGGDLIKSRSTTTKLGDDINRISQVADAVIKRSELSSQSRDNDLGARLTTTDSIARRADKGVATLSQASLDILAEATARAEADRQLGQRIDALGNMAGIGGGSPTDGAVSELVQNGDSLTHASLEANFVPHNTLAFDVRNFGAKGDGTTDDSAAFHAAIAAAKAAKGHVYAQGTFRVDTPIRIDCNAYLEDAQIDYYGTGIAITVTGVRLEVTLPMVINSRKSAGSGWGEFVGSIGVRLLNCNGCNIFVKFVQNFEQGLSIYGDDGGCAYNSIYLGWMFNNKIGIVLDTNSTNKVGYSNQNEFIGGRASLHAAEGTNIPGTKALYITGPGDGGPNNNVFLNTCLEGAGQEYAFDIDRGKNNYLINVRMEYGNAYRFGSLAKDNDVHVGYVTAELRAVRDDAEGFGNHVRYARAEYLYDMETRFFKNGDANEWLRFRSSARKLELGRGSGDPVVFQQTGAGLSISHPIIPASHGTNNLGTASAKFRDALFSGRVSAEAGLDLYTSASNAAATDGLARVFARTNQSGKAELCVVFPTGGVQILASQP